MREFETFTDDLIKLRELALGERMSSGDLLRTPQVLFSFLQKLDQCAEERVACGPRQSAKFTSLQPSSQSVILVSIQLLDGTSSHGP